MRIGGVWRSLLTLGIAFTAIVAVGCQPQSASADRHGSQVEASMPTVDHHPPPRTPEN